MFFLGKVLSTGHSVEEALRSYGGLVVSWSRSLRNVVWFGKFITKFHNFTATALQLIGCQTPTGN